MHIFFTGAEARKSEVPFLLDASMQPITATNAWLQELAQDGATSSPCSWKTYAYHLFDYFSYLEAHHLDWRQVNNETVLQYRDVQDQNRSGHTKEHRVLAGKPAAINLERVSDWLAGIVGNKRGARHLRV